MDHSTPLRELLSDRLGMDVCVWVAMRRQRNPGVGWRTLAEELHRLTGRHVAFKSLANWCSDTATSQEGPEEHRL